MSKNKILVVDDEPLMRNFLQETLSRQGHEVELAENGLAAMGKIEKTFFDIIITDMKMPHKSGLDVLKFAKEKNIDAIVIIMTAFASIENAVEAMNRGAFNYLIKPFSPETIEALIKKANEHFFLIKENDIYRNELFSSFFCIAQSFKIFFI